MPVRGEVERKEREQQARAKLPPSSIKPKITLPTFRKPRQNFRADSLPVFVPASHSSFAGLPSCRRVACTPSDEKGSSIRHPRPRSGIQGLCFFQPPHPAPFDFPPPSVLSPSPLPLATLRTGVATAKSKNAQDRLSLRERGLYKVIFIPRQDKGPCIKKKGYVRSSQFGKVCDVHKRREAHQRTFQRLCSDLKGGEKPRYGIH